MRLKPRAEMRARFFYRELNQWSLAFGGVHVSHVLYWDRSTIRCFPITAKPHRFVLSEKTTA